MKRIFYWIGKQLQALLTLIIIIVDRQILVFAPWVSSYEPLELSKQSDRFLMWMIIRVVVAFAITVLVIAYNLIF